MGQRPPTALHVSWRKRADGEPGGVEKFAFYLRGALMDRGWQVVIISWGDFPRHDHYDRQGISNPDKAHVLGTWLDSPAFGFGYDVAVSDGYWGNAISNHRVVPVVHGTWAEFHARMGLQPTGEVHRQGEAFTSPNAYPVACSAASARELRRHHGRAASAVIPHGIDLGAYRSALPALAPGPPWIVLQAAGHNAKKGGGLMEPIQRLLGADYIIEYLDAKIGEEPERWRRGHVFLHPTRHEGNAYACLEALATDLPIVTTAAGVFEDIPADAQTGATEVGFTLPITATPERFAQAIRQVCLRWDSYRGKPRRWAEQNANMTAFTNAWDGFLRQVIDRR